MNPIRAFIFFLPFVAGLRADDLPQVKAVKTPAPSSIATEIAKSLATDSIVLEAAGKTLATFWIRDSIPMDASPARLGYASLKEGTLIGVVEIVTEEWTDFRKQNLKPGVYTLRIGFQPKDGNHMGVSPSSEFLCLANAAKDLKIGPIEHKALMNLSKTALDTGHPVVLHLSALPENFSGQLPSVARNELMHVVLQISGKITLAGAKSATMPLGIVVVGQTTAD